MSYVKGKRGLSLEDVARLVLQKRAAPEPEEETGERGVRPKPKVTLPRLTFLERPLPAWWNEDFARRPVLHDPDWQSPL